MVVSSCVKSVQERGRWVFIVAFSLSLALLWYVRVDACASSLFTWLGLLPMQVISQCTMRFFSTTKETAETPPIESHLSLRHATILEYHQCTGWASYQCRSSSFAPLHLTKGVSRYYRASLCTAPCHIALWLLLPGARTTAAEWQNRRMPSPKVSKDVQRFGSHWCAFLG